MNSTDNNIILITSEYVGFGHPDIIADTISDSVLDSCVSLDRHARVAIETMVVGKHVVLGGEITINEVYEDEIEERVNNAVFDVVSMNQNNGIQKLTTEKVKIKQHIRTQSPEIAMGVDSGGAGDQGCLKSGTLVRTSNGYVKIEDVKVGDYVNTHAGLKKVLVAKKTGTLPVVKITLKNGYVLECTADHKILCFNKNGEYWKEAGKLTSEDLVCVLKENEFKANDCCVSEIDKNIFTQANGSDKILGDTRLELNEDIAYIIGLSLGNGYLGDDSSISISFGKNESDAILMKEYFSVSTGLNWNLYTGADGNYSLVCSSVLLRKHFENFGVGYEKSPIKTTPHAILKSKRSVIENYIAGLFDSDGTIVLGVGRNGNNAKLKLSSSSYALLQEVQLLLKDFNVDSTIVFNTKSGSPVGKKGRNGETYFSNFDSYVLHVVGINSIRNFYNNINFKHHTSRQEKLKTYCEQTKHILQEKDTHLVPELSRNRLIGENKSGRNLPYYLYAVKSVEDTKEISDVYDLEIEDIHAFSGNGIIVHNCMFGFSCNHNVDRLPTPLYLSRLVAISLNKITLGVTGLKIQLDTYDMRHYLYGDVKTQFTVEYDKLSNTFGKIRHIVCSIHHGKDVTTEQVREWIKHFIINLIDKHYPQGKVEEAQFHINSTGAFTIGGSDADTGMTGRKLAVNTYGGFAHLGGGALCGKDVTKVDRSGALMTRYVANQIIKEGLANIVEIGISYGIGLAEPLSVTLIRNDKPENEQKIIDKIMSYDYRPQSIIYNLRLKDQKYVDCAMFGHFGIQPFGQVYPWEK